MRAKDMNRVRKSNDEITRYALYISLSLSYTYKHIQDYEHWYTVWGQQCSTCTATGCEQMYRELDIAMVQKDKMLHRLLMKVEFFSVFFFFFFNGSSPQPINKQSVKVLPRENVLNKDSPWAPVCATEKLEQQQMPRRRPDSYLCNTRWSVVSWPPLPGTVIHSAVVLTDPWPTACDGMFLALGTDFRFLTVLWHGGRMMKQHECDGFGTHSAAAVKIACVILLLQLFCL